jgi:hypothetical protein
MRNLMWLEDEEIDRLLESDSCQDVQQAIEALVLRWEGGDRISVAPLRAESLRCFDGKIPLGVLNPFLDFLLGLNGFSQLPKDKITYEIAKIIALFADVTEQQAIALRIKVHPNGPALIRDIIFKLSDLLDESKKDQLLRIEFFLSSLLDGTFEIRTSVIDSLRELPRKHDFDRIVRNLAEKLRQH